MCLDPSTANFDASVATDAIIYTNKTIVPISNASIMVVDPAIDKDGADPLHYSCMAGYSIDLTADELSGCT